MKKIALVLSGLLISSTAVAGSGFYGELSVGQAKSQPSSTSTFSYEYNFFGDTDSGTESESYTSSAESSTSFGARLGYKFNDYIAAEAGYHQYGEATDNYTDEWGDSISDKVKTSSTSIGLKGILPLSDQFSLFARAGYAKWDLDIKSTDSSLPGDVFSMKEDGNNAYFGFGLDFNISESVSLGLEYSMLNMEFAIDDSYTESDENFYYSLSSHTDVDYEVTNIALLLKMNF